ncbi:hypothetical protein LZ30DRAFT_254928 [Colletotrichum cereale]|nr:hypothetical protein LZ30DRAFT_254928 [Colletotrichum cereale]
MIPGVRQKFDYPSHVTPLHDIFFLLCSLDFISAFGSLGHHTPLPWSGRRILGCNVGMVIPQSMCWHVAQPPGCGGKTGYLDELTKGKLVVFQQTAPSRASCNVL